VEGRRRSYFDNYGNNRYPLNGACLFRPALAGEGELARKFCPLGATNDDLAGCFEVARCTIDDWIATIPDFADGVKQGRDAADAAVVQKRYARATGADWPSELDAAAERARHADSA